MDPALFRVDWEVLLEVVSLITVLAFFVERALSIVFEHRLFINRFGNKGLKEPMAFFASLALVRYGQFDAVAVLLRADSVSTVGYVITAAIIAGGSKASIKLFHDLLQAKSTAEKERLAAKKTQEEG